MIRLIPDWLLYIIVIAVVVFVLFRVDERANAPEALPETPEIGAFLPPPSQYDPKSLSYTRPVCQHSGMTVFSPSPAPPFSLFRMPRLSYLRTASTPSTCAPFSPTVTV